MLQTTPAPSAPPAVTEQPKPGLSAEMEEEEEEEDGSAPVGMTFDAVERPSEEAAEAELWRQGLASELMMHYWRFGTERQDCSDF